MDNTTIGFIILVTIIGSLLLLAAIMRSGKAKHESKEESTLKRIEELEKKVEALEWERASS